MPKKGSKNITNTSKDNLKTVVYDTSGKSLGNLGLPAEIFGVKASPNLMAHAIRVYQLNQRQGTVSTKTRSQVRGSTRKIYRQKGTGRARHGDIKAPIFIGGGIAHGPKPRDWRLKMPQKMRRKSLFAALTDKFTSDDIRIVDGLEKIPPKTKNMVKIISGLKFNTQKKNQMPKTLLVLGKKMNNVLLAGRNLPYFSAVLANQLNTYQVLTHQKIVFTPDSIKLISDTFVNGQKNMESDSKVSSVETVKVSAKTKGKTEEKVIRKIKTRIKENRAVKKSNTKKTVQKSSGKKVA